MIHYPTHFVDDFSIKSKLKHRSRLFHATRNVSYKLFVYELNFTGPDSYPLITVPIELEVGQCFISNAVQDAYYSGQREFVNSTYPPSHYIRYYLDPDKIPDHPWIRKFIQEGAKMLYPIDEVQFRQSFKNGYWFFLNDQYVSESTDVIDSNAIYGVQIHYTQNENSIVLSNEIISAMLSKFEGKVISIDQPSYNSQDKSDYIFFRLYGSHSPVVDNMIQAIESMGLVDVYPLAWDDGHL